MKTVLFINEKEEMVIPRLDSLEEFSAYCRGFLLLKDVCIEKACIFCRGFLLSLYHRYLVLPDKVSEALSNGWNIMYRLPEDDKDEDYFCHSIYMRE